MLWYHWPECFLKLKINELNIHFKKLKKWEQNRPKEMCKKKRRQIVNGREGTHKIEGQQSQKFIISKDPWNLQTDSETDQLGEREWEQY